MAFNSVKKALASKESKTYRFWFRRKYNLPPKDPRFLAMEDWELELEFLTWDSYEDAVRKQNGTDSSVEEYEVGEVDFKSDIQEFAKQADFDPNEWEEVMNGQS